MAVETRAETAPPLEVIRVVTDLSTLPAPEREKVRALVEGDAVLWSPAPSSSLVTILGGDSEPAGPLSLELGLMDADARSWIEPYLARLDELEASLPLPSGLPDAALGPKRDALVIADVFWRGGARAGSTALSTFLPADRSRAEETGRTYVFWRNLVERRWYEREIAPAVDQVLVPDQRAAATAGAHLRFYATRFTTYQLGPQSAATDGGRAPLREHFGELYGPLVIAKADLLGVLAHEWLIAEGIEPPELSFENLAMLVVMAFRALADVELGEAPPPHPANLQLSFFRDRGAVELERESGLWRFDPAKLRAAARELVAEILAIHATGDLERGRRLLDRHGAPGEEIAATVARVAALGAPQAEVTFEVTGLEDDFSSP